MALLLALAAGAWIAADVRGRALWKQHLAELEAAGRSFDPERLFTPAVEGTFWADPFVRAMMDDGAPYFPAKLQQALAADPDHSVRVGMRQSLPAVSSLGVGEDLETFFPHANLTSPQAAERILRSMSTLDDELGRFCAAVRLPVRRKFPFQGRCCMRRFPSLREH